MSKIYLKRSQLAELIDHSRSTYPEEACGILSGKDGRVSHVYKVKNISPTPATRYFIDSQEQLKIFKEIDADNLEIVGIYHSHAHSPAYPSTTDCQLAFYPDASYLIISLSNPENPVVKSYRISEGKIKEEEVKIYGD